MPGCKFVLKMLALLVCAAVLPAEAQDLYDRNLVVNGGAEAGPAVPSPEQSVSNLPGWRAYGGFTVTTYNPDGITMGDDGPADRGKQLFIGGRNAGRSYAEQVIALNGMAPGAKFHMTAFMGKNYGNQNPRDVKLTATFQDDRGQTIQETTINGPDTAVDYGIPGGLQPRSISGYLLPNVTQVKVIIELTALNETNGSSLVADNIELVLTRDRLTGVNILNNGNLEASPAASPVRGWNGHMDSLKVKDYSNPTSRWDLVTASPGPAARGKNYMHFDVGGDAGIQKRMWQTIEVTRSPYQAVIDAGQMRYRLEGWLGVAEGVEDEIKMRLVFQDGRTPAGTIGAVETATLKGQSGAPALRFVGVGGGAAALPAGTRRVLVEIVLTKRSTVVDDMFAYADEMSLVLTAPPQVTIEGVGNAANYVAGKVSAGEILVVYGTDFGPDQVAGYTISNGAFTTSAGETRVYFDDVPAPMLYSASGQLSCIVPYSVTGRQTTRVQAEFKGEKGNILTIPVSASVPGLFTLDQTGRNQLAALNSDYSLNGASRPAARGSIVMLFGTGEGPTTPSGSDGKLAVGVYPKPVANVTAQVGGRDAEVLYAGAAPDLVAGVIQINVRIPADAPLGNVPVVIKVGTETSQSGATLTIR